MKQQKCLEVSKKVSRLIKESNNFIIEFAKAFETFKTYKSFHYRKFKQLGNFLNSEQMSSSSIGIMRLEKALQALESCSTLWRVKRRRKVSKDFESSLILECFTEVWDAWKF